MDHGKMNHCPFFNIKFRYTQVKTGHDMRRGGTPGDDVHFGIFLGNHNVMYILDGIRFGHVQAGLNRLGNFRHPGFA